MPDLADLAVLVVLTVAIVLGASSRPREGDPVATFLQVRALPDLPAARDRVRRALRRAARVRAGAAVLAALAGPPLAAWLVPAHGQDPMRTPLHHGLAGLAVGTVLAATVLRAVPRTGRRRRTTLIPRRAGAVPAVLAAAVLASGALLGAAMLWPAFDPRVPAVSLALALVLVAAVQGGRALVARAGAAAADADDTRVEDALRAEADATLRRISLVAVALLGAEMVAAIDLARAPAPAAALVVALAVGLAALASLAAAPGRTVAA